jgi:hypothetical protein
MKLPEDGPKYGPKHVAVIKNSQCKQLDWFILNICCVDGRNITNHGTQQDANSKDVGIPTELSLKGNEKRKLLVCSCKIVVFIAG